MSKPLSLFLLCASTANWLWGAADAQSPNTLTHEEKLAGWVLLFDGRTMNGWDDPRLKRPSGDAWRIKDGCLKAHANPRITEDLFTIEKYRDFELAFDWRISPGGNSGVKYRIEDHWFVAPHEHNGGNETFEQSVERSFRDRVRERPAKGQDYVIGFEYQITDDTTAMQKATASTPRARSTTWWRRRLNPPGPWVSLTIPEFWLVAITWNIG